MGTWAWLEWFLVDIFYECLKQWTIMIVDNVLGSRTVCSVTGSSDVKLRDGDPPLEVEIIKVEAGLEKPGQHKVDDRKLEKIENQN